MSCDSINIKRGDTLDLGVSIPESLGAVISQIECDVNNSGAFVQTLTVTPLGSDGTNYNWTLSSTSEQTAEWPAATLSSDLLITYTDGKQNNSESFSITVRRAETKRP